MSIIRLEQVSVSIHSARLLHCVSLTIKEKESVVFHGPSGGGKSSLLKVLLGGVRWTEGVYYFEQQPVTEQTIAKVRQAMAYIPQQPEPGRGLVEEWLQEPFRWRSFKRIEFEQDQVLDLFRQLKLNHALLKKHCSALSGGQRQQLAIIRALISGRKLIVADEPTSALDKESSKAVRELLLSGQFTVISASHDPQWISACNRQVEVGSGQVCGDVSVPVAPNQSLEY